MVQEHWKERSMYTTGKKTNILGDCLLSVVENVPLIALRKAKRTMKVSTGVSVTQQFVRVVLKTLGYAYKKVKVQ
jgi:transposase